MKFTKQKNVIFAAFKPRTLTATVVAIILASVVLKTYDIGDQNSSFCHAVKPQNVLGGTEQGRLVSGINLKLLQMPRTAKERPTPTLNESTPKRLIGTTDNLPTALLERYSQLDDLRVFFENYEKKFNVDYLFMNSRLGSILCSLYEISDKIAEIIGEEIRIKFFCKEENDYLIRKECA